MMRGVFYQREWRESDHSRLDIRNRSLSVYYYHGMGRDTRPTAFILCATSFSDAFLVCGNLNIIAELCALELSCLL